MHVFQAIHRPNYQRDIKNKTKMYSLLARMGQIKNTMEIPSHRLAHALQRSDAHDGAMPYQVLSEILGQSLEIRMVGGDNLSHAIPPSTVSTELVPVLLALPGDIQSRRSSRFCIVQMVL